MTTDPITQHVAEIERQMSVCAEVARRVMADPDITSLGRPAMEWGEDWIATLRSIAGVITREGAEWDNRRRER